LLGESSYSNVHTPDETAPIQGLLPLLTEGEYERIQRYLDSRHTIGRPVDPASAPILVGRLFCPCGARMYVKKHYYYCSTLHTNAEVMGVKPCRYKKYHRYDATDVAVWESITRYLSRDVLAEAEDPDTQLDVSQYEGEIATCERELEALKHREAIIYKTFVLGEAGEDTWQSTRKTIRSEQAKQTAQLHAAQHTVARLRESWGAKESLDAAIRGIRARITSAQPQERRALIHAIIPPTQGYGITLQMDGTAVIAAGLIAAPETAGTDVPAGGSQRARVPKVSNSACRASCLLASDRARPPSEVPMQCRYRHACVRVPSRGRTPRRSRRA
jgi:hypothetical protein